MNRTMTKILIYRRMILMKLFILSLFLPFVGMAQYTGGVADGSTVAESTSPTPLPVELLAFHVQCNQNVITISWQTASEVNNYFFTVLRSADGEQWKKVENIQGAGNSNEVLSYEATDKPPSDQEIIYYQLRQTDFNGAENLSGIQMVRNCMSEQRRKPQLTVFPVPSSGLVNFSIADSLHRTKIKAMIILDAYGNRVYRSNEFKKQINFSGLPSGLYYVKLLSLGGVSIGSDFILTD